MLFNMNLIKKISKVIMRGLPLPLRLVIHYQGTVKQKCLYYRFAILAIRQGCADFRVDRVASEWVRDWCGISTMDDSEKSFFINHGISPYRKYNSSIDPSHIDEYVPETLFYSDRNYCNLLVPLFDNKLHTYYALNRFRDNLPNHYCYIYRRQLSRLDGYEGNSIRTKDVVSLIQKKVLAAKKCVGGHGDGFYKFHYEDDQFYINDQSTSLECLSSCITSLDDYIITDFLRPASRLRELCGEKNFFVIRAITAYDTKEGPQIIGYMARVGSSKAGNTQAGHDFIYIGINMDNGTFFNPRYEVNDAELYEVAAHPETHKLFSDYKIDNIEELNILLRNVSSYFPMAPYLVYDIIPTDDGFKILEINSHGQPFMMEPYYNIKNNKYIRRIFDFNA